MAGKSSVVVAFLGDTTGLDKAMGKAQTNLGRMGGVFQKIGNQIGGEFGAALGAVGEGMDKLGEKSAKNAGIKVGALGAIATGVGVELMNMASAPQQAMAQLTQAITDSGHSYSDYRDEIEKTIAAQQNLGHSETDTEAALQTLTQATNDPKKALEQMGIVANLAAAKHISLADSAQLVAKILAGKGARTLTQFGIVMKKAVDPAVELTKAEHAHTAALNQLATAQDKYKLLQDQLSTKAKKTLADQDRLKIAAQKVKAAQDLLTQSNQALKKAHDDSAHAGAAQTEALDQLSKKLKGQADASVDNFAAKVGILRTKLGDWAAQTAGVVGPAIAALGPVLMVAGSAMEILTARKAAAAAADVALSAAQDVQTASTVAATGATDALAVSEGLALAPVLAVVAVIGLLVGAFVLAYQHVDWFRKGVDVSLALVRGAFSWLVNAAQVAFGWIKDHLGVLALAFGPLGVAVAFLGSHWSAIWNGMQTVVQAVWKVLRPIFDLIGKGMSVVANVVGKVASIGGAVGGAIGHLLGFADGGEVPGATGAPRLAVVHGGEYVVSNDMRSGRKPAAGLNLGSSQGAGVTLNVTNHNYHPTTNDQSTTDGLRKGIFLLGMSA